MSDTSRPMLWQLQWHEILNEYPDPDGGASVTPEPLPQLDADYRVHFNLWQVSQEARCRAFAMFPCGTEMLARVDKDLSSHRAPLGPEQAVELLRTGLKLGRDAGVKDLPACEMQIDTLSDNDIPLLEVFQRAGDPFCGIVDRLSDWATARHGCAGRDAYFFLLEPLYRLRSAYQVAHWVLWPLCSDPLTPDLTEARYRLFEGGWSPGWTGKGLFIFDRREELKLN
jgi:hypothetical protein